jgi:iron(III) transport system substrate-binding protein
MKQLRSTSFSRRVLVLGIAALSPITLAACGSSSSGSGGKAASSFPTDVNSLYAAAKKEGEVVWYTTSEEPELQAGFEKAYPGVKLTEVSVSGTAMVTRIAAEQKGNKYSVDVVNGESSNELNLRSANALAPYTPPDESPLPSGVSLPAGYATALYANTTVIAYNPKSVQKLGLTPPTSVSDFANPKWNHQISVDPTAVTWYLGLGDTLGGRDKVKSLMEQIGKNNPVFVTSRTAAVTAVQSGDPAATMSAYGYRAASLAKKDPSSLVFVNPTPLPTTLNVVNLVRNAPHPNAARLLIDWLSSKEGQEVIAGQTGRITLRSDVPNNPLIWDPSKWKPQYDVPNLSASDYNNDADEFSAAIGNK